MPDSNREIVLNFYNAALNEKNPERRAASSATSTSSTIRTCPTASNRS